MKNRVLLWGWSVLTWFRMPESCVAENDAINREVLKRNRVWSLDGYIERQSELGTLRFGKGFTMAYGGCGLIALYNALVALGREASDELLLEVMADLQRRGIAWFGKYGTHPAAIRRWLVHHGYFVERLGVSKESFAQKEKDYKVYIVTVLNGSSLQKGLHTVCITRVESGFVVHNGFSTEAFATLHEAVCRSSKQGATAIYAMGLGKRQLGSLS